jgi:hypothetical protein
MGDSLLSAMTYRFFEVLGTEDVHGRFLKLF